MMKNLLAVALMAAAGSAVAAASGTPSNPIDFEPGTATERKSVATTYTYTVAADRADRLFVKNEFDFTLSSNVILDAAEEEDDGRFMAVGTANTQGRNVFIGHSNGGSVNGCGDPLTAEEAKEPGALADALSERFLIDEPTGCKSE